MNILWTFSLSHTVLKVSKYGVFSGPYFPAFGLNMDQKKLRIWTLLTQCDFKKMSIRCSYLSVFSQNVGKYEPEKTLYLDTFNAVWLKENVHKIFVSLRIQSKCWKIRTRKNSVFGHISHSVKCTSV